MPSTQDFEHILDDSGVVGVEYDTLDDTVRVFVEMKKDESVVQTEKLIRNRIQHSKTDVLEVGVITPEIIMDDSIEAQGNRKTEHDPIVAGVSECNAKTTAATAGPIARVKGDEGKWREGPPSTVRLSNNHVYARSDKASFNEPILQPSPMDGGTPEDDSGKLVGKVPVDDGTTVDVAARTARPGEDSLKPHELDEPYGKSVYEGDYADFKGKLLTKTGRTTGVTTAEVIATDATVSVKYPEGQVTLKKQILTNTMSKGGDSGSPVFVDEKEQKYTGDIAGLLFAGSSKVTVLNRITQVEKELGVSVLPVKPPDEPPKDNPEEEPPSEETFEGYVEGVLISKYGEENVKRQHHFENGRIADFVVLNDETGNMQTWELENDAGSLINGMGQALFYRQSALHDFPAHGSCTPVLCFPEGEINEDERQIYERIGVRLREFALPAHVEVEGV